MKRIIDFMELSKECHLGNVIFKKSFLDNGDLSKAEKQLLNDQIEKVLWQFSLKPSNCNIEAYKDDDYEFSEIEMIEVRIANKEKAKKIAQMIMRTIPYPMVLEMTCSGENRLIMGDSTINHNDVSKNVLREIVCTNWMQLDGLSEKEKAFLASIHKSHLSSRNLFKWYQDLMNCITRYNASLLTDGYIKEESGENIKKQYEAITALEQEIEGLKARIKRESQFNRRLELNVQIKKLEQQKIKMIKELEGGNKDE